MTSILALKLALVPALIGAVTLAGRRWGPGVAGWLSAFPIVSGPILFFIALEQGSVFVARAAVGTLAAVIASLVFAITYAWTATRFAWPVCLSAAFATYACTVALLRFVPADVWLVAPFVFAGLWIAPRLFPSLNLTATLTPARGNDIYLRMVAGATLVYLVTRYSTALGPQLSGVFAMFPIMSSVLAAFSHRHSGAGFAVHLLRGMVLGFYSFATFCLVLALTLPSFGIAFAFVASIVCAALVHAGSHAYVWRKHAPPDRAVQQSRL